MAILSAVETVSPNIPSTLDAAALCKMADRRQITGGLLDGPLAFDNAISAQAALIKQIASPVAGQADILAVPDLESGNMLAKQLEYLAGPPARAWYWARVPIALTSRADGPLARVSSALLASSSHPWPRSCSANQPQQHHLKRLPIMAILAVNAGSSTLKFSIHPCCTSRRSPHPHRQHPGARARQPPRWAGR